MSGRNGQMGLMNFSLYVQGSFLSIADEPHPLDPMYVQWGMGEDITDGYRPIPLEVHPAAFAALPKLTLQAGLANAMPGAPTSYDDTALEATADSAVLTAIEPATSKRTLGRGKKGRWGERKKFGLWIHVEGYVDLSGFPLDEIDP